MLALLLACAAPASLPAPPPPPSPALSPAAAPSLVRSADLGESPNPAPPAAAPPPPADVAPALSALGGSSARPPVRSHLGVAAVSPELEGAAVDLAVLRIAGPLEACAQAGPARAGRMVVRVEVSAEGRVTNPRVVSSTVGDRGLERCVLAAAADVVVQPPESGKAGTVSFPVRFTAP